MHATDLLVPLLEALSASVDDANHSRFPFQNALKGNHLMIYTSAEAFHRSDMRAMSVHIKLHVHRTG